MANNIVRSQTRRDRFAAVNPQFAKSRYNGSMIGSHAFQRPDSVRGPRPIDVLRDVPQILSLLDEVFRPSLSLEGRRALSGSLTLGHSSGVMMRLSQTLTGVLPGFVWEENGRIVGNVSLLAPHTAGLYLVANVAVHPLYRRRGIARQLMAVVIEHVRVRGGRRVQLQVEDDNVAALQLYYRLGFTELGVTGDWTAEHARIRSLAAGDDAFVTGLLAPREWQDAYALDCAAYPPDLDWPQPWRPDAYKSGFWPWLRNLLNGRQQETWVIRDPGGQVQGLIGIQSEYGRAHVLRLRVSEPWRGQLERPLLAKALRRLHYLSRRSVRIEHIAGDENVNALLQEANFTLRRRLTTMRLEIVN